MLKRFFKNEKGQSVLELAITIPVLLLVLCAIVDFGWIYSNKMLIIYSSREGARFGSINATAANATDLIKNKVNDTVPSYLKDKITVNITFSDIYDVRTGDVKVKISGTIKALTPLTGIFVKDQNITLSSQCIMKIE